jgi:uncharacterized protein YndB with AHSA1/START domain
METHAKTALTVEAIVSASPEKVWSTWTDPKDITQWCNASDDWHAPFAENDLKVGGKFKTTMAARDGSVSFDFEGTYTSIQSGSVIEYTMEDGRKVKITFSEEAGNTKVVETFEAETTNSLELQQQGWQAILNNFKKYTEAS